MADSDINVDICNLALSHVGGYPIQSVSEATKEARECKRLYPFSKDSTLEAFDWSFARKQKLLAEVSGVEIYGWDYVYEFPSDCIIPRKIYDSSESETPITYDIYVNSDLNKRYIVTDQEDAVLIYTAKVSDANLFSPLFKEALGYRLASELAIPLRSKPTLKDQLFKEFSIKVSSAESSNANASERENPTGSSFQDAR